MKCRGCGSSDGRPKLCHTCTLKRRELKAFSVMTMYAQGMTLDEIGKTIGRSRERVRMIMWWSCHYQFVVRGLDGHLVRPERATGDVLNWGKS